MIDVTATVLDNRRQYQDYWRLRVRVPAAYDVQAGQFAMLRVHGQLEPILRRAMVYYRIWPRPTGLDAEFIYRVIGRGTTQLSLARQGDHVDVLGPLGRGFSIDPQVTTGTPVALVSGGIGIPAVYLLAEKLIARGARPILFHGDRTSDVEHGLVCVGDFVDLLGPDAVICATEDGSLGQRGFVTVPLEAELRRGSFRPAAIYACGPEPMMKRVAHLAQEFAVPAYVSLEAAMACGFGVCIACAQRVRRDGEEQYVRVCVEGPVFRADEVIWA
ncbi:MAG: dihydroorotate dehydrogenase electron transfer subunit [Blastocatellia bacterium]|nr:dihydroorotate dehydrogenase electron transfer subunit [Blastocatellia bacterium]